MGGQRQHLGDDGRGRGYHLALRRGRLGRVLLGLGLLAGTLALPAVADAAGAPPAMTISSPALDQSFNSGLVTLSGEATDDGGVQRVDASIRNTATNAYLKADGTFSSGFVWLSGGVLGSPGATSTTWTFQANLPAGNYQLLMRVGDVGPGTVYTQSAYVRFGVVDATGDPTPPTLQQSLGGPLHAEFYSSGLELDPQGNIIIADTGNNQVAKYDADGNQLWRVGAPGPDDGEFWHPRDVSVAPDGRIFVVDTENERIVRLGADGSWLGTFNGPASFPVRFFLGGTVSGDKFYLADLAGRVRVFDLEGNQLQVIAEVPATVCADLFDIRDAAADSAGNVYVAGYRTNSIMVFAPDGSCLGAWGSTGTADGQFKTPYGVYVKHDPVLDRELVYVTDALNNRVQVFELDGSFVGKFGTYGTADQPGTLYTLRRAAPAMDGSGDVWVADLWAFRLQRYERTATGWDYEKTIGAVIGTTTDTTVFHEPRGLAVDASGIVNVMDTVHHQLVRISQTGAIVGRCGVRGSDNGQFNWPRDVDIDQSTGDIWIADTKFNRIQALRPNCAFVAKRGSAGSGPSQFNWPRALEIRQSDRTLWIADTQNNRIVVWSLASRSAVGSFGGSQGNGLAQFNRPMGIAVDPTTGNILVADTMNDRIAVLAADPGGSNIRLLRYLSFDFHEPEAVAVASDGTTYVADTGDSELVMLSPAGGHLATFGTADGIDHPSGIAVDATGKLFVSDSFNDRVRIYSRGTFVPDGEAPETAITSPAANAAVGSTPVTVSGTATDNVGVAGVRVGIRDNTTNQWWNGSGWSASASTTVEATLAEPGASSTGWTTTFTPASEGSYLLQAQARDATPNTDASKANRTISYTATPADTTNPNGTLASPTNGQVLTTAPVVLSGAATDNVAVSAVRLSIRRGPSGSYLYWNGAAWVADSAVTVDAELASPGATSTGWSYTLASPVGGAYRLVVTAVDSSNRVDATKPNIAFTYTPPAADTTNPNGTLASPTNGQVLTTAPVVLSGAATDNVAVSAVRLSIRRGPSGSYLYWDGAAWVADSAVTVDAELASPGATSTGWSYTLASPVGGAYRLVVTAVDSSNRVDATKPNIAFTYTPPVDTTNPTVAIGTPTVGQAVPLTSSTVVIRGSATDNVAVSRVRVAIRKVSTAQYWNGTAWQSGFVSLDASLATPGTSNTTWTYTWALPPGTVATSYALQVTSVDSANRTSPNATRTFTARG